MRGFLVETAFAFHSIFLYGGGSENWDGGVTFVRTKVTKTRKGKNQFFPFETLFYTMEVCTHTLRLKFLLRLY